MAVRNIVKIDEEKCNGCRLCVTACAEGAIQVVNGKARLVSETYCDGLGACLGHCPQGAIMIEQREAAEFDEKATHEYLERTRQKAASPSPPAGCPGMAMRNFRPASVDGPSSGGRAPSQLGQWPVQLALVSPGAPYYQGADVILAADCAAFAMGDFHNTLLKGHSLAIACPKLDDTSPYVDKLAAIIQHIRSLKVVHMEVPCCLGLVRLAQAAIAASGRQMDFQVIKVGLNGNIIGIETVRPHGT
ncbi:MAG TPA: 4Fe-4S binding protein [Sedimentisphaerales bacterium]|nr:4Fe-4S binding protein [Sedimentisphaerales bacterium]